MGAALSSDACTRCGRRCARRCPPSPCHGCCLRKCSVACGVACAPCRSWCDCCSCWLWPIEPDGEALRRLGRKTDVVRWDRQEGWTAVKRKQPLPLDLETYHGVDIGPRHRYSKSKLCLRLCDCAEFRDQRVVGLSLQHNGLKGVLPGGVLKKLDRLERLVVYDNHQVCAPPRGGAVSPRRCRPAAPTYSAAPSSAHRRAPGGRRHARPPPQPGRVGVLSQRRRARPLRAATADRAVARGQPVRGPRRRRLPAPGHPVFDVALAGAERFVRRRSSGDPSRPASPRPTRRRTNRPPPPSRPQSSPAPFPR